MNTTNPIHKKAIDVICVEFKTTLLTELTTKYNSQLDHILGTENIKILTTAFKNLPTDHKAIVLRISKLGAKNVDIFGQHFVLIPIHLGTHWTLAVADINNQDIKYFDSMGGYNEGCLKTLECYLIEEHRVKKGRPMNWRKIIVRGIPQQLDTSDCGMFLCKYAEYLTRKAQLTFTQENMPFFRIRMIIGIAIPIKK